MAGLFARLGVVMAAALPLCAGVRALWLWRKKVAVRWLREGILCLFAGFTAGLLALVWQPGRVYLPGGGQATVWQRLAGGLDINLVPLASIRRFFAAGVNARFVVNIVANVLMFCPVGFCPPLLWRRWQHAAKVLAAGAALSGGIECVQLFIGRSVDVDDVLLNVLGVMLGYGAWWLLRRAAPRVKGLAAARRGTA